MMTHKSVRIFVRVGVADLQTWLAGGAVDVRGRAVQAVTDRARRALPEDDEEELEYAALCWAAEARPTSADAGSDVGSMAGSAQRVIVAVLSVPPEIVHEAGIDDPDRGFEVVVGEPLSRRRLAALHVADGPAEDVDAELSWYDASELAQVAALTG